MVGLSHILRYVVLYMVEHDHDGNDYGLNRKSKEFRSLRAAADFVRSMKEPGSGMRFVGVRRLLYQDLTAKEAEVFKYLTEVD